MTFIFFGSKYSHIGKRKSNEDYAELEIKNYLDDFPYDVIGLIADGVSTSKAGGISAKFCVNRFIKAIKENKKTNPSLAQMENIIRSINKTLLMQKKILNFNNSLMTTLTILLIKNNSYFFCHVGDSRLYLFRKYNTKLLTKDDVSKEKHNQQALLNVVGFNENIKIQQGRGSLKKNDTFLLATDGVWKYFEKNNFSIKKFGNKNKDSSAKIIVESSINLGAKDNASAVLIKVDKTIFGNLDNSINKLIFFELLIFLLNFILLLFILIFN